MSALESYLTNHSWMTNAINFGSLTFSVILKVCTIVKIININYISFLYPTPVYQSEGDIVYEYCKMHVECDYPDVLYLFNYKYQCTCTLTTRRMFQANNHYASMYWSIDRSMTIFPWSVHSFVYLWHIHMAMFKHGMDSSNYVVTHFILDLNIKWCKFVLLSMNHYTYIKDHTGH